MFKNEHLHAPGYEHAQYLLNAVALLTHGPELAELQARHWTPRGFPFQEAQTKLLWRLFAVGAGSLVILFFGLWRYRCFRRPPALP
jgi:hypothetical protein